MTDILVRDDNGVDQPFNQGKLVISIARAFAHDLAKGKTSAWDLAQTVSSQLFLKTHTQLTTAGIAQATHEVLDRFDQTAAAQYALAHGLMASLRRRGRPSFGAASGASPAPEKLASPSR